VSPEIINLDSETTPSAKRPRKSLAASKREANKRRTILQHYKMLINRYTKKLASERVKNCRQRIQLRQLYEKKSVDIILAEGISQSSYKTKFAKFLPASVSAVEYSILLLVVFLFMSVCIWYRC
jgi:hypothetical protein